MTRPGYKYPCTDNWPPLFTNILILVTGQDTFTGNWSVLVIIILVLEAGNIWYTYMCICVQGLVVHVNCPGQVCFETYLYS